MKKIRSPIWLLPVSVVLLVLIMVLLVVFFTHGEVVITGSYPEVESTDSITCTTDGLVYPIFVDNKSNEQTTRIIAIFSDGQLKSISLEYTLSYQNEADALSSEPVMHAAMNKSFSNHDLPAEALNVRYSVMQSNMRMSLNANSDKINNNTAVYFLLDEILDNNYNKTSIKRLYAGKGFRCTDN